MSTNKKPRKKYKPRRIVLNGCFYTKETINELKDIINNLALVVFTTLPSGRASDANMHEIEDLLNWIGMMLFDRKWKGQEQEAREFTNRQIEALYALAAIVERKKVGKTSGYVAKAEELKVIQEVCSDGVALLKEGMEVAPERTTREFLAARQLAREQLEAGIRDVFELPGRTRAILNQRHFRRP